MPALILDDSVLSPDARGRRFMPFKVFQRIIEVLERERWHVVTLHYRGDDPPPYMKEALGILERSTSRTTPCRRSSSSARSSE